MLILLIGLVNAEKVEIIKQPISWKLYKNDGPQRQDFTTGLEFSVNAEKICLYPKTSMASNDPRITGLNVYYRNPNSNFNQQIQPADIEVVREAGKVSKVCYDVKNKNMNYLQFGPNSTVWIKQEESRILFESDYGYNLTWTLMKNTTEGFQIMPDDVWVYEKDGWKIGANDTYATKDERYKYIVDSTTKIYEINNKYYTLETFINTPIYKELNFDDDVCNVVNANCLFNLTHTPHERVEYHPIAVGGFSEEIITDYTSTLSVEFTGFYNSTLNMTVIDPSIYNYYPKQNPYGYFLNTTYNGSVILSGTNDTGSFTQVKEVIGSRPSNYSGLVAWYMYDKQDLSNEYGVNFSIKYPSGIPDCYNYSGARDIGFSCDFDGVDDYFEIVQGFNQTISGDDTNTVAFWVRADVLTNNPVIVSLNASATGHGYLLEMGNGNFYWGTGNALRTYTVNSLPGEYYHIVAIKNGTGNNGILLINGEVQTSFTGTLASMPSYNSNFRIGTYLAPAGYYLNGRISNLQIYNVNLSISDAQELFKIQRGFYIKNISWQTDAVPINLSINFTNTTSYYYNNTGIIAELRFKQNTTASNGVLDETGNYNATIVNGAVFRNSSEYCPFYDDVSCYYYDGINDYGNFSGNKLSTYLNKSMNFSISVWARQINAPNEAFIIGNSYNNKGWHLRKMSTGYYRACFLPSSGNYECVDSNNVGNNDLTHFLITYNGSSKKPKLYVNGVLQNVSTGTGFSTLDFSTTATLYIGYNADSNIFFRGYVDQVTIYNRTIENEEAFWLSTKTNPSDYVESSVLVNSGGNTVSETLPYNFIRYSANFNKVGGVSPVLNSVLINYNSTPNSPSNSQPNINLSSPVNGTICGGSFNVTYSINDSDNLFMNTSIFINDVVNLTNVSLTNGTYTQSYHIEESGVYNIKVSVTDGVNTVYSETRSVSIDHTSPAITILTQNNTQILVSYHNLTFSTDENATCNLTFNGNNYVAQTSNNTFFWYQVTGLVLNQNYYYNLTCSDTCLNTNTSGTNKITRVYYTGERGITPQGNILMRNVLNITGVDYLTANYLSGYLNALYITNPYWYNDNNPRNYINSTPYQSNASGWIYNGTNIITNGSVQRVGIKSPNPTADLMIGTTASLSTATPTTFSMGGTYADSVTSAKAKWKFYDDGNPATIYGIGISLAQFNFFKYTGGSYNWYFSDVEKMRLTENGLGIGDSPSARLHVKGLGTTTGTALLIEDSAGTDRVAVLDNGNVGIGTASPTQKLDVNGSVNVTSNLSVGGDLSFYNTGSGLVFGSIYLNNASTIPIASSGVWYEVNNTNFSGAEFNEVVNGSYFLNITKEGVYFVDVSGSLSTGVANQELAMIMMVNGVANERLHCHTTTIAINKGSSCAKSNYVRLNKGDIVSLGVENHDSMNDITVNHLTLLVTKHGG